MCHTWWDLASSRAGSINKISFQQFLYLSAWCQNVTTYRNLIKADMDEVLCSVCIIVPLAQESVAFIFIMMFTIWNQNTDVYTWQCAVYMTVLPASRCTCISCSLIHNYVAYNRAGQLQPTGGPHTVMHCLTIGIRSEKCVVRWFCHWANIIQCTYSNLDSVALLHT